MDQLPESSVNLAAQRQAVLAGLYDYANGSREPAALADLPAGQLAPAEVSAAVGYLRDAGFVEASGLDGSIQLTHLGIVEVERSRAERVLGMDALGWSRVDADFLRPYSATRSTAEALAYIDGRRPGWEDCLPGATPRRRAANAIVADLAGAAGGQPGRPRLWVILGATGEGKSTALMQVVVDIALRGDPYVVLWRRPHGRLLADDVAKLPKGRTYLIASDDGEEVAGEVLAALQKSRRADVHYLIAATTTDWQRVGGGALPWHSYAQYGVEQFRGLDQADAELIVRAWAQYGRPGLQELEKQPDPATRAAALVAATKQEASLSEGAFFGGMLRVRYGEYLKDHIRELLRKLISRKKRDGVPYPQIYMLIAAAHSAELLLTPEILATAAGLNIATIRSAAIDPLSDEAVVTMAGGYVLVRHRLIATASLELAEGSGMNLPELYAGLVRAALVVGRQKHVDGYDHYIRLSRYFEKSRLDIAVAVAEAVYAEAPDYLANVHNLARVLLLAKRYETCSATYRKASSRLGEMHDKESILGSLRRVYYFEWGHSEHKRGNDAVSCWLAAVSIADPDRQRQSEFFKLADMPQEHMERALTSMSANLLRLHKKTGEAEYLEAANGVIVLTRRLKLSPHGRRVQQSVEDRIRGLPVATLSDGAAKLLFREAARLAFEAREQELPAVPTGHDLQFTQLFAMLGV